MTTTLLQLLVGREAEREALTGALADAVAGRGGVWLVRGEAGIGKSCLVEDLASRATGKGLAPIWGRCWEGGGAPAYWPWTQVLRALLRHPDAADALETGARRAALAQLLPEVSAPEADDDLARRDPDQARFRLWDAVSSVLVDAAMRAPLLVLLEDLHAADPSSVQLLEMLGVQARGAPLLVVGTQRDEVDDPAVRSLLSRLTRMARVLALPRLGEPQVARWLGAVLEAPVERDVVHAVHRLSEGHPLYVAELARWLVTRRAAGPVSVAELSRVPHTVRDVIRARLDRLDPPVHDRLAEASVLGREWSIADLAALAGEAPETTRCLLGEGHAAGVVARAGPDTYRFAHVLFRDVLYDDLPGERRRALHLRVADRRAASGAGPEPPWTEVAHHLLLAAAWDRALEACVCAAEHATRQLAFDEAVTWYERALDAHERLDPDLERRAELLLDLGRARIRAGHPTLGQRTCREAADAARKARAPALLARAALGCGEVYVFAHVDPSLVALLREALDALDDRDTGLRARVLARLAGAMQPAEDPSGPVALAREALAMARRLGEPAILLDVLRSAGSALMDIIDPAERRVLNQEMVALARRLNAPHQEFYGAQRLVFDAMELGDVAAARAAIERCAELATTLDTPGARWRVSALRALEATHAGRMDEADRHAARAEAEAALLQDVNAARSLKLQQLVRLRARGADEAVEMALAPLFGHLSEVTFVDRISMLIRAATAVRLGDPIPPGVDTAPGIQLARSMKDRSLLELVTEIAVAGGDLELAGEVRSLLAPHSGRWVSWGVFAMAIGPPVDRLLGVLDAALGDAASSDAHFDAAFAEAQAGGAPAEAAWTALDHARALHARGESGRAAERLATAHRLAAPLDLPGLTARIESLQARPDTPRDAAVDAPVVQRLAVRKEGRLWRVTADGTSFHVKDVKGMQWIAHLLETPGEEIHVLDLVQPASDAMIDAGDAGEVLDRQAIEAYRTRVRDLRGELEEAEDHHDLARAERARAELDFLEAELSAAVGLGGRPRRTGQAAERARVNVQRRIKHAVELIAEQSPGVGRHLEWALRTGTYCSYRPW